jgi:hypothetical protein
MKPLVYLLGNQTGKELATLAKEVIAAGAVPICWYKIDGYAQPKGFIPGRKCNAVWMLPGMEYSHARMVTALELARAGVYCSMDLPVLLDHLRGTLGDWIPATVQPLLFEVAP